jgi:signal transduction histidine kinase
MTTINVKEVIKSIEVLCREMGDEDSPISSQHQRIVSEARSLKRSLEQINGPELNVGSSQIHSAITEQGQQEAQQKSLDNKNGEPGDDSGPSEQHYRELFDDSPVAIWVDDWSPVKQWLDTHTEVVDWRAYFQQNPEQLTAAYRSVNVIEVSQAAVTLYKEESRETLLYNHATVELFDEELNFFLNNLIAFWTHNYRTTFDASDLDDNEEKIVIRRHTVIPAAHQGNWSRVIISLEDITERVHLEAQLRQSQKMEMVGQLTGGIAHDFNNMLAIIQGNAQLLTEGLGDASENIEAILNASHRASDLTQRLLVFSRKHRLEPTSVDLGVVVEDISNMLAGSLGETIDIKYQVDPDLWFAFADVGQVENALLNLTINAKDAMPEGGLLTIECTNVHLDEHYIASIQEPRNEGRRASDEMSFGINLKPGDYVLLSVTDTGQGMTEEVLSQVFEPFFTTKQIGAGTGLGLSMVYSFVKQSGGHIEISSEPGKGTSVMLYLKRAERLQEAPAADKTKPVKARNKGGQILLLEDDEGVRAVILQMLDKLGYQVVSTTRASEAKQTLAQRTSFDLILSDVILPGGTSGPEFVKQALVNHPELKCVFMSGYASLGSEATKIPDEYRLLNKPFTMEQLADALDSTLD